MIFVKINLNHPGSKHFLAVHIVIECCFMSLTNNVKLISLTVISYV